jgi:hypothetical protein
MLYFRLWDTVVDWALSRGFSSIQSGQTTYGAKIEMGHDLFPLVNYGRHRKLLIHIIYRRIVQNFGWAELDEELALFLKAYPKADAMSLPAPPPRLERGEIRGSRVRRAAYHAFRSFAWTRTG